MEFVADSTKNFFYLYQEPVCFNRIGLMMCIVGVIAFVMIMEYYTSKFKRQGVMK
jgi:hypothetical protein